MIEPSCSEGGARSVVKNPTCNKGYLGQELELEAVGPWFRQGGGRGIERTGGWKGWWVEKKLDAPG